MDVWGLGLILALLGAAGPAGAGIRDDPRIHGELFAVAVGDEIRTRCPSISARMFEVMARAKALERYALGQGYSQAEIDAYLESRPDQERYKRLRDRWLAERGAVRGDAESYCRIGRAEIAAKSPIGLLLRSR